MPETILVGGHALLADGTLALVDVRVRDGLVVELGSDLRPAARSDVVEVSGFTMPGLIDAHTHVAWAGTAPMPTTMEGVRARVADTLQRLLRSGVTTIRDVGSIDGVAIAATGGPTRWCANQIVCAVGGHGTEPRRSGATCRRRRWRRGVRASSGRRCGRRPSGARGS